MSLPAGENGTGATQASWQELYRLDSLIEDGVRGVTSMPDEVVVRKIAELMRNMGLDVRDSYDALSGARALVTGIHRTTGHRLEIILDYGHIVYRRHANPPDDVVGKPPLFFSDTANKYAVYHRSQAVR